MPDHSDSRTAPVSQPRFHADPAFVLISIAALAFYLVFVFRGGFDVYGQRYYSLFDDSMISMRYARNLAEGYGVVWNPGDAPVEGFMNHLATAWMAVLHLLPIPDSHTSLAVMLSGIVVLILTLVATRSLALLASGGSRGTANLAAFLVAFSYPLVFWTLRGMETGFVALTTTVCLILALLWQRSARKGYLWALSACVCLNLLSRLDTAVPGTVVLAYILWTTPTQRKFVLLAVLLPAAAVVAAKFTARYLYFGELLPNIYYLKLTGTALTTRVGAGVAAFWNLLTVSLYAWILPLLCFLRRPGFRPDRRIVLLLAVLLGQCAYSMYVGGDAWEDTNFANRFISVAIPALAVAVACSLQRLTLLAPRWFGGARTRVIAGALAALAILAADHGAYRFWLENNFQFRNPNVFTTRMAVLIRDYTTEDAVIGVVWAGAIPYFGRRRAVDLLGMNDKVVARTTAHDIPFYPGHMKWDFNYSLGELSPDIIPSLWRLASPAENQLIRDLGYRPLDNQMWVLWDRRTEVITDLEALSQPF